MVRGLVNLIGGRAPPGHRQSWWADGPGHVLMASGLCDVGVVMLISRSCFDVHIIMVSRLWFDDVPVM